MDEIWSFIHSKNQNVRDTNWGKGYGDCWTWVSLDADSKLAINWHIGGRDSKSGREFVSDLSDRLKDRIQLTSDGLQVYLDAVKRAFGDQVDYAMLIKTYAAGVEGHGRYSPPECVCATPSVKSGSPDAKHISTSYVERSNFTMRMQMRRFTRLTNGFSKKLQNHKHAIALYFFHYNFIRVHQTLKTTPAVAASVTDKVWTMVDFVKLLEREENLLGGRLTNYKPNPKKRIA